MKFSLLICFSIYAINADILKISSQSHNNVEGFYWRHYTGGEIPSDALPGGVDDQGNPIYVAQALFRDTCSIVAGQIRSTTKLMTLEMRKKEEPGTQDIKILCTVHPEQFQWIKSENNAKASTFLKNNQQFITSGLDGKPLVIGRASVGKEILIGKVITTSEDVFFGVHIGINGNGLQVNSFELLVYDPTLPQTYEQWKNNTIININIF